MIIRSQLRMGYSSRELIARKRVSWAREAFVIGTKIAECLFVYTYIHIYDYLFSQSSRSVSITSDMSISSLSAFILARFRKLPGNKMLS